MVLNRSHLPWAIFVLLATAAATVLFLANFHPELLPWPLPLPAVFGPVPPARRTFGGTPLGLLYGAVSLGIFLFAAALGIRKKRRLWRIIHVQIWLRAHIWLTILTIPLVLLHCGFRFGGLMPSALMLLYGVVMISGFFGLAMQQVIPRLMTRTLPQEVVYEQIPHVRKVLLEAAETLWKEFAPAEKKAGESGSAAAPAPAARGAAAVARSPEEQSQEEVSRLAITTFLHDSIFPYLRLYKGSSHYLGDGQTAAESFRVLRLNVGPKWQEKVAQMEQWCWDRRLLDKQARLHHWLHWWLLVHVPLSFALLVWTFWHAYVALNYL